MHHHHGHEYAVEEIPGLPERLPAGETILWRGAPRWSVLALHVFHVRAVAVYFAILAAWRGFVTVWEGGGVGQAAFAIAILIAVGAVALGVLTLLAVLVARTTIYTITTKRVVMRYGVALPKAINIPFTIVGEAALRLNPDGTGDIPLTLTGSDHIAYVHLWPHTKPWSFNPATPMLRGVPQAETVASVLAGALKAAVAPAVTVRAEATNENAQQPTAVAGGFAAAE